MSFPVPPSALRLVALLSAALAPACGPAPDVGNVREAGGMVADARGVFVTGARPATPAQGGIFLMQVDASAAERIAGGDGTLSIGPALCSDERALYFAGESGGAWGIYRLSRAEGASPERLCGAEAAPAALVTDGSNVYFAVVKQGAEKGDILSVPTTGGTPQTVAASVLAPRGLAVDATSIYFTDEDPGKMMWQRGEVRRVPLAGGGASTVLAVGLVEPGEIAVVPGAAIVVDAGSPPSGCSSTGGTLLRVSFAGGEPVKLDYDLQGLGGLVVADGNAWYRTGFACGKPPENAAVWRVAVSGLGHTTPLAQGIVGPRGLAVDARYIYWTIVGTGTTEHAVLRRAAR